MWSFVAIVFCVSATIFVGLAIAASASTACPTSAVATLVEALPAATLDDE